MSEGLQDPKMVKKISKAKIKIWLADLKAQGEVLIPAKKNGIWAYRPWEGQELPGHYSNSRLPPKNLFLESPRALLSWKNVDGLPRVNALPIPDGLRVIVGLRPCDARALRILQPVFAGELQDVFYLANLSRTLLVGEACKAQCPGSFCQEMGVDPQDSPDCDLFFRDTGEGKVVRGVTEEGKRWIEGKDYFAAGSEEDWDSARVDIRGQGREPLFDLEKVKGGAAKRFHDEDLWKWASAKCVNCGVCTYLCPTCHCFDLCDLQIPSQGARFRCWDSCAFPDFTRMAVHNPREEKWRRYRQRVSHKFNFFFQNFQRAACVGCGRCVVHCPVNLDLREVLMELGR